MPRQPHSTAPNAAVFGAQPPEPATYRLDDDGRTPNGRWPVLHYRSGAARAVDPAGFERLFAANGWPPQWRGGVFDFHHYHSVSHEALAVHAGAARLVLGGEAGRVVDLAAGDVLILPAGTGHCRLSATADFGLAAAYPPDQQDWDLCRPGETEPAAARARIAALGVPASDPVAGAAGGLVVHWR
ncbi:cupin domain-containing protein [Salinisphaera orenii]|uniref:cupin domain-containing protein n=1 Tax=Salinisphaera orenii TaxID=856731 RepID=UPI000F48D68A|nr:cupin domain-containing protein [Salinisphaera halophila]